ncbi:hypothetical protein EMPS_10234 [Entomortierella parvispora]|uniref:Uncharacterized protein n=1 Tax=Entomortierella parvispora TaxID=205924 RepID=A0A9P3M1C5_9FUNG|nr:hypothetical protein EMPS_10234 [Entomortierella parvispora]
MSNPHSPTRQMQAYQQYRQEQQQQQPSPQQQHIQSLAVWSPSVPAGASGPPSPSSSSSSNSGSINISGPLDLKTQGPHPILPPVKQALPPSRPGTPSRATSLRRQLSQSGLRQQNSYSSLNQSYDSNPANGPNPGNSHPPMPDPQDPTQSPTHSSASSSPLPSPFLRTPASTPGGTASYGSGNASSNDYFENRSQSSQQDGSSLLSISTSPSLQRSNSKVNYSSPLFRSLSPSNSPLQSPSQSPSPGPLKRQASILKNGSKDAPYLSSSKGGYLMNQESLNHAWEPSAAGPNPAVSGPSLSGPPPALSQYGSASNLRAMATNAAAAAAAVAKSTESQEQGSLNAGSGSQEGGLGPVGASPENESAQPTQASQELVDREAVHVPARDSANYKVPVPPSPIVSPRMGPSAAPNAFNFLNSDPTLQRSTSRRRMAPPIQVGSAQQYPQSALSPSSLTSPVSPSRRIPRWDNMPPQQASEGHGQDHHEDGDYEDDGLNDDTDGDGLSGAEDQAERRRRRQRSGSDVPFTPTRSAPQPPSLNAGVLPNSRQAEIAHIMYIQQQQALFLQEKAMNPPLRTKGSNGNLSGGNSDGSKPGRKTRHRKQISVISVPKLVSSTNQVKTVPIVRPADQSDNDDAGARSEYTSGGEGIKKTVRRMRRAVRSAANGVFHDDDSDREDAVGSKSDAEKKGGLKQLKALRSKLAKKLHRPSHGGSSRQENNEVSEHGEEGSRGPVQFFSEDNLRARYLQQEQMGGNSLAAAGAALRRSNTTRDAGAAPMSMYRRRGGEGDKQEFGAMEEIQDEEAEPTPAETDEDAAAKARMAKFGSRTFDKDEMMEVKDGTGESFFVPRWDFDPRADELGSSKSVISVQSSKKLDRSPSTSTVTSSNNSTSKAIASIAERLQGSTVAEGEAEETQKKDSDSPATDAESKETHDDTTAVSTSPVIEKDSLKDTNEESVPESATKPSESEEKTSTSTEAADHQQDPVVPASNSSASGLDSRASVVSEASSNVSSVGGVIVAQVLTRQSSMKRNFRRSEKEEETKDKVSEIQTQTTAHFGLGISIPSPVEHKEKVEVPMSSVQQLSPILDKKLPPIPSEARKESVDNGKPFAPMTIRPLSPIRRGTINSGRTASIASVSSTLSTPTTPPAVNAQSISPLESQLAQEASASAKAGLERKVSQSRSSLRTLSLSSFTLPKAPTSPLPSPSASSNPAPAAGAQGAGTPILHPFPAVLARQGSNLAERASIRSMYADSIYDCYDYDSASEYESQIGGSDLANLSRQGSFNTAAAAEPATEVNVAAAMTIEKSISEETATTVVSTLAASIDREASQSKDTISLLITEAPQQDSSNPVVTVESSDIAPEFQEPVIRPRKQPLEAKKEETEEHHVLYEDLPKAVPYRMSMMTTVTVEPTGATLTPSRPPRHPMRQSRHGSMMSMGGSSDLTLDSWRSSNQRDTRDDLSGWDVDEERDSLDQDGDDASVARRPSFSSSLRSRGRSERSLSVLTDKSSHRRILEDDELDAEAIRRGSVDSVSIVIGSKNVARSLNQKHWRSHNRGEDDESVEGGSRRETWTSIQSSSSDSATSSSSQSSQSSHFYFNGRSPSPSPTEETAPVPSTPF